MNIISPCGHIAALSVNDKCEGCATDQEGTNMTEGQETQQGATTTSATTATEDAPMLSKEQVRDLAQGAAKEVVKNQAPVLERGGFRGMERAKRLEKELAAWKKESVDRVQKLQKRLQGAQAYAEMVTQQISEARHEIAKRNGIICSLIRAASGVGIGVLIEEKDLELPEGTRWKMEAKDGRQLFTVVAPEPKAEAKTEETAQ